MVGVLLELLDVELPPDIEPLVEKLVTATDTLFLFVLYSSPVHWKQLNEV